ncbi:MAG TPA: virulence factor [Bacteroidota bacterium]|nr:virulence factor [Bacteroidota bacterium]
MAFYQVLRWQEIPTQIKAWDDFDEVKLELPPRFMIRVDQVAQSQGLTGTDDYLNQWKWSEPEERKGTASDVADAVCKELEAKFPK